MFSRLAVRAGALSPLLRRDASNRLLALAPRSSSSLVKKDDSEVQLSNEQLMENWDKANKIYYGPERDLKNFPTQTMPEFHPPTRLGFMPDAWFTAFYDKTGVTGPYLLGGGILTLLLSKEFWIVEHNFSEFLAFWATMYCICKKWGPSIKNYFEKERDEYMQSRWYNPLVQTKANCQEAIEDIDKMIWREDGQKHLFESRRENIDFQLEEAYRKQLASVHTQVKKRLDYQMELENTKTRYQQTHMVNWVVDNVMKSITPDQEKQSITKCIQDLKAMGARA